MLCIVGHKKWLVRDETNERVSPFPQQEYNITMESIIMKHQEGSRIMCTKPHVFLNKRSCQTGLITFYDKVVPFLDKGNDVKEIFWGFSKLDSGISHQRIIIKSGLEMNIVAWIENWLESYKHRARKDSKTSSGEASRGTGATRLWRKNTLGKYSLL